MRIGNDGKIIRPNRRIVVKPQNGDEKSLVKVAQEQALGLNPRPLPEDMLPIDMRPRLVQEYKPGGPGSGGGIEGYLAKIARDTDVIQSTLVLDRGLIGRVVTITTTPQRIIRAEFLRGYIFLNPATVAGLTSAGTILALAERSGTTNSDAQGVANFLEGHFWLDITVAPGGADDVTIRLQALDPASLNYADVQDLMVETDVGTFYGSTGQLGLGTDFRIQAIVSGAASATFSVGFVLKNGLIGTSTGVNQSIFLGGKGVTTVAGYPLLEGKEKGWYFTENTELYAVAAAELPLRIFEL
jgi:hypothetical protein